MLAEISSGNIDAADWFFLVAVVLAVLAAVLAVPRRVASDSTVRASTAVWSPVLGWLALGFAALALLVL